MAGTINYLYDPQQAVWVITPCDPSDVSTPLAVRAGTIIQVRAVVQVPGGSEVVYDVQLENTSGTTEFAESDVFPDLATAVAEYEVRLT